MSMKYEEGVTDMRMYNRYLSCLPHHTTLFGVGRRKTTTGEACRRRCLAKDEVKKLFKRSKPPKVWYGRSRDAHLNPSVADSQQVYRI
ncbi:hypothetical protein DPMN_176783 [Dreissena polymorpha]|uniref:Uncharacterized protein n=1 Tax=Dreissena polymorpha TaxID=45954 RepID=A0A9D4E8Y9_DREPO|nr:hypothetical protein DPMN_176783 [Dreissena polymorpha]